MIWRPPQEINVNANVEVTEKRAPTDESVRLLKEMQEKAEEARIKAFDVRCGEIEFRVEVFREAMMDRIGILCASKVRGRVVRSTTYINRDDTRSTYDVARTAFDKAADDFAKALSETLLRDAVNDGAQQAAFAIHDALRGRL